LIWLQVDDSLITSSSKNGIYECHAWVLID
jgi:hypothetical protein